MSHSTREAPLTSPRGKRLIYQTFLESSSAPVVTVEDYCKWYELFVVHPDGRVESRHFGNLEPYTDKSAYVDHVPNPAAVCRWAEFLGFEVDEASLERMVGRWVLEARNLDEATALQAIE